MFVGTKLFITHIIPYSYKKYKLACKVQIKENPPVIGRVLLFVVRGTAILVFGFPIKRKPPEGGFLSVVPRGL